MAQENVKRTLNIIYKVVAGIIMAATLFMVIFTIVSTLIFDRNDRNLFGIRFYIVLSDSMSLSENNKDDEVHFDAGDIVLIKNVEDKAGLGAGDIISFISQNSDNFGETVTHKIRERIETEDGRLIAYVTYGTNTGVNDVPIEPEYVLGKYVGKLPNVGTFFNFLKTTTGYIVCILVPFILVILYQGVNTVALFKKYKKEQMADLVAEREQIEKERAESAAMMRELLALKEQLNKQNAPGANPTENPPQDSAQAPAADENTQN